MIGAFMTSKRQEFHINPRTSIIPALGEHLPISAAVDRWFSDWPTKHNSTSIRVSSPGTNNKTLVIPTTHQTSHMTSLDMPQSAMSSARGPYIIDFGRKSSSPSPRPPSGTAMIESPFVVDFGRRTPDEQDTTEKFIVDFGPREVTPIGRSPSPDTPHEEFMIAFGSPTDRVSPRTPSPSCEFVVDFGSRLEEQYHIDFGKKSLSGSPMQGIVVDFGTRAPSPPPSPMSIVIDFGQGSSSTQGESPTEEYVVNFGESPDDLRGVLTSPPSSFLIDFGARPANPHGSPMVMNESTIPNPGPAVAENMLGDFPIPPFLLMEPDQPIATMSKLDYDFELSQVAANMQSRSEPVSGPLSPLHRDFLGLGPESSPSAEPANLVLRSPIIHAALRYGYKTGPEQRSLPTFIDQYVSGDLFVFSSFVDNYDRKRFPPISWKGVKTLLRPRSLNEVSMPTRVQKT